MPRRSSERRHALDVRLAVLSLLACGVLAAGVALEETAIVVLAATALVVLAAVNVVRTLQALIDHLDDR